MSLRAPLFIILLSGLLLSAKIELKARLPVTYTDSVHIAHYLLDINLTNISGKTITGHTRCSLTTRYASVNILALELFKLNVDSVTQDNNVLPWTYNDTLLTINLPTPLQVGDTQLLDIYYHGIPKTEPYGWGGFHFSGSTLAYNLGIALQDVPHNYGRIWFPCLDQFTEKATYDFQILVNDPLMAVCNGVLTETDSLGNGTTRYHWHLDKPVPAYLASVAVSNYIAVQDTFHGVLSDIPTYIYVKPADTTKARNSFINLNQVLTVFEDRFGPYRWPRVGYVSTPLGAMEHATNIAYPTSSIDGTLSSEPLYAHELSHMWFGDLVTCASQEDMWINEGWAVFSEFIFKEGIYGPNAARDYIRDKHHDVLKLAHHDDGDFYALAGIPPSLTYGTTVYEKGGQVVKTLRNYMGDSLFFSTVKAYTDSFAFKHISSIQLRDFFTASSGMNLTDFFDTWVFNPGFPHYSIDSVRVQPTGPGSDVTVFIRQKMKGTSHISNSNILEIGFCDPSFQMFYDSLHFSGLTGSKTFHLPFHPVWTGLDPNEKISDATTDAYHFFVGASTFLYPQTYCKIECTSAPDTALVRVTHHWVGPDPLQQPVPGFTLSPSRYWSVEGYLPAGFHAKATFSYSKFNYLDHELITDSQDSIVLLYRPGPGYSWQGIPFLQNGITSIGELTIDSLRLGEYALAVWDDDFLGYLDPEDPHTPLIISPNPASGHFHIIMNNNNKQKLRILNPEGKMIDSLFLEVGQPTLDWAPREIMPGLYIFRSEDLSNGEIKEAKAILLP